MRLALQALFGHDKDLTGGERTRIENELRKNARSVEFFRKIRQTTSTPLRKAPEVFADESFPDPNIVAEYLDCQLDSSEISEEYERVCDESPEILAEVADCYDILNNRLPQPPVVPQNCRQQLYYVAWEEEPPTVSVKETKKTAGDSDKNAGRSARSPYEEPVIDVKPDPSVRVNARADKRRGDAGTRFKLKSNQEARVSEGWVRASNALCFSLLSQAGLTAMRSGVVRKSRRRLTRPPASFRMKRRRRKTLSAPLRKRRVPVS